MIVTIILFLLILAVLIFVHELGHFLAAKMSGIRVDEFALGFPPRIASTQIGETTYALNAVPFGGYVKIFGEDGHTDGLSYEDKKRSFEYKSRLIKAIVLAAGVSMNIIFGWLLISAGYMIGLPTEAPASGNFSHISLVITEVLPNSPADKAGLVPGDVILSVSNGSHSLKSPTPENVSNLIAQSSGPVILTYAEGSKPSKTVSIQPVTTIAQDREAIGISMDMVGILKLSLGAALLKGAQTSGNLLLGILLGLGSIITNLIHPSLLLSQVSGPVGIARAVGQANAIGFVYVISLVALISLNLAVINLIPFPALDGGRLFIILIESITRRSIHPKVVNWVNMVGFALLIILMLAVTAHDIFNLL